MRTKHPELTEDELIDLAIWGRMMYWLELANAMSQKHFRGPNGEVPDRDDVEHAFRMKERHELLYSSRRRDRGIDPEKQHFERVGEIAKARSMRIVREQEHYLESFIAETGLRPSQCALIVQTSADRLTVSYQAVKKGD